MARSALVIQDDARRTLTVDRVGIGMAKAWRAVLAHGIRVLALGPTPWLPVQKTPRDCLSSASDWRQECVLGLNTVMRPSAVRFAAQMVGVPLIDLTDAFCIGGRCPPIIGGVLVYRDNNHVTASYSRSLANRFERELAARGVAFQKR